MRDFESRASASSATPATALSFEFTIGPEALLIKSILPALLFLAATGYAQPGLTFETAAVTAHPIAPGSYMIKDFTHGPPFVIPTSNRFKDTAHAEDLIMEAFGVSEYQILYLPAWARSRETLALVYDIDATAKSDAAPTPEQLQLMLQALLADRFHLKTHWETKAKFPVNALVVDKGGPKFHEGGGTTLFALAHFLSPLLDFPAVDRTGLAEKLYDFDIDKLVSYRAINQDEQSDPNEAQDYLRAAVQHQIGLRLEPRKESMQMLVIDHIDEPSKN